MIWPTTASNWCMDQRFAVPHATQWSTDPFIDPFLEFFYGINQRKPLYLERFGKNLMNLVSHKPSLKLKPEWIHMDPSHLVIHGPFWVVFLSRKKSRIISIIIISSYTFHSGCWNLPIQHFHHPSGRFQPVRFGAHSWPRTNRRVLLGAVLAKTTEPPGRGPKRRLEMCVLVGGPVEDPEESRWRSRDGSKAFKTTIFGFI